MVNNIILGLTGQSGAGKSTVSVELAAEGCSVLDCDVLAHRVIQDHADCKQALAEQFGADLLDAKGTLNRKLLGSRAFATPEATAQLNSITHPYILQEIREEIRRRKSEKKQFLVLDAPTLLESGCGALCDFIMVVTAPEALRIERIQKRDGLTEAEAVQRMKAQPPETFYLEHADFRIDGTLERDILSRKVRTILKTIAGGYDA